MKGVSRFLCGLLLALAGLLSARAGEVDPSHGDGLASATCRTGLDGVTTCISIRGYVRAGDGLPAPLAPPAGGAFAPAQFGFSQPGLGSEPQPGSSFSPLRVYVESGANGNR